MPGQIASEYCAWGTEAEASGLLPERPADDLQSFLWTHTAPQ